MGDVMHVSLAAFLLFRGLSGGLLDALIFGVPLHALELAVGVTQMSQVKMFCMYSLIFVVRWGNATLMLLTVSDAETEWGGIFQMQDSVRSGLVLAVFVLVDVSAAGVGIMCSYIMKETICVGIEEALDRKAAKVEM